MIRDATFSPCEQYRYTLTRRWDQPLFGPAHDRDRVVFLMLNPSTADARVDDPTIRRCMGFARTWGFASLLVLNLFAWRSTDPAALLTVPDPIGPDNDRAILEGVRNSQLLICAWGAHKMAVDRGRQVLEALQALGDRHKAYCLSITNSGEPGHPLYLPEASLPLEYLPIKAR